METQNIEVQINEAKDAIEACSASCEIQQNAILAIYNLYSATTSHVLGQLQLLHSQQPHDLLKDGIEVGDEVQVEGRTWKLVGTDPA